MTEVFSKESVSCGYVQDAAEMTVPANQKSHQLFESLIARAARLSSPMSTGVIWPCEQHALEGALDAAEHGLMQPVLIGDKRTITQLAEACNYDLGKAEIIDVPTPEAAATQGVSLVREGRLRTLMKGSLHTDILMHAIVAPDQGLRTNRRVSHVFLLAIPDYSDLVFVTDAAINIFPDLEAKRDIVQNAIDLHIGLGLGEPRVALLSAVEVVNPKIPGTVDAACLCKMAERKQIQGGILDGPLAMDNAVNIEAARIKGIESPVAGRAQILVSPDLESGNMLAKNMIFMSHAESAGIVLGAKVPILLTSRADSVQARLASVAVGALYADYLARNNVSQKY
ncbi:phosphate acetyltransferase [Acetobacter senegalensis]|uniref:Phosphate acetyltransferase n=1 Tax=Acetobacter senegalensis TaxID=446692 RepID=A0A149U307_9PROT|nr:phosphate acetyltransferase [Acetobacter senegalensis]